MNQDLLKLAGYVLDAFQQLSPVNFWGVLAGSLVVAALLPLGCRAFARLTDLHYRFTLAQAAIISLASILTFVAALTWFGVDYLSPAIKTVIGLWQLALSADHAWNNETFRMEYWGVHELRDARGNSLEDFANHPPPEQGGNRIPLTQPESRQSNGRIDATRVAEHFERDHPFLAWLLTVKGDAFPNTLKADIDTFFKERGSDTYPHQRAITLAGRLLKTSLEEKLPGIIFKVRLLLAGIIALLWLPLLAWVTYRAWNNLEPVN